MKLEGARGSSASASMVVAGAVVGWADAALCALLATAVMVASPGRATNRMLALLLFFEGTAQFAAAFTQVSTLDDATRTGLGSILDVCVPLIACFEVLVVSALDSPITRPMRRPAARALVLVASLALVAWAIASTPISVDEREGFALASPARAGFAALGLASAYGLVAGAWAFAAAPRASLARRQAGAFLAAFGARDVLFGAYVLVVFGVDAPYPVSPGGIALPFFATLVFVPLVTYAILRTQVFDIDLRLKVGVRRALFLVPFVAAFFLASQLVERYTTTQFGLLGGAVAAVALFLAARPIERLAQRASDRLMPRVAPTDEYVSARKLEVYRAAVESAHESGGISEKERDSLRRLREKLAIGEGDASAVEREVEGGAPQLDRT